ncbi:adenylate kinase [Nakamurella sp. UYEF19]|uniref:adenylate kinase n=1 Tax=Nakamurella sp. UYEF19 TaxID=1756392 RepID=UPI0033999FC4
MRLLIFGPQGVGKGTQAAMLAPHWGIPHISTGDLFRANISADTFLGKQAKDALAAGELVPDSITQGMLAERLNEPDARSGFLLDGFPRTPEQAEWLEQMIAGTPGLDAVVLLTAPNDVLIGRAVARGRFDDEIEAIERRLALYHQFTEPLLRFYGDLVESIDGNRSVELVHQNIIGRIGDRTAVH